MAAVVDSIRSEHRTMGRLLDLLEAQVDLFENAEQPDYDLIREIIDYFLTSPDLYHHPKEDLVFRRLKSQDAGITETFGNLEEFHEEVSERLHEFTRAVVNVLMEVEMPRETFVSLAREFISGERTHMKAEEKYFLPLALNKLTDRDWDEIDSVVRTFKDPLDPGSINTRFVVLSEQMTVWQGAEAR